MIDVFIALFKKLFHAVFKRSHRPLITHSLRQLVLWSKRQMYDHLRFLACITDEVYTRWVT